MDSVSVWNLSQALSATLHPKQRLAIDGDLNHQVMCRAVTQPISRVKLQALQTFALGRRQLRAICAPAFEQGRDMIKDYRLQFIGKRGIYSRAVHFLCSDDLTATVFAEGHRAEHTLELWQSDRMVAEFPKRQEL